MLFNIIKSVKSLWDTITHTEIKQLVRLSDEQGSGSHHQTPTFFDQQIGQKFDEIVLPEFTTDTNAPSTIGLDRQILSGLAWLNKGLQGLASTLLKFAAEHPSQVCILLGLGALTYNLVEAAPGDTVIDVANNRTGIDVGNGICWAIPRIYYAVGQYNCSLSVLATNGQPGIFTLPLSVVTRVNHPNVFLSTLKTMLIPLYAAYSRPILFIGQVSLGLTGTINHLTAYGCYSNYYQVVTTLNGVSKTEAFNLDVCIINIPPYSDPHTVTTHASLLVGSNELNGFTAIDPDGDDLTYTGTLDDKRMPSGWFINPANNQVTILINRDDPIRQVSNHSYLSTADDHFGGIVSARMAITIINRAPFYTQHYTDADNPPGVKRGQRLVINLRSNYEDPEGDQVTTFVPAPWALPAGTVLDPQFSLTIAPIGLAPRGPHLVYFSLMDSLGMRSIAQEPITITYDNWDPVIKSPSAIVIPPVGTENWCTNIWALNLDPLCTDADFDPLTLMLSGGPNDPQLHFNNGTLCIPRITPLALETSEASTMTQQGILWCVDRPDGGLPGSSARVPVTFRRTNSAPVIEGGLTTLHLALNGTGVRAISLPGGSDPDGQPLSWSTRSMGYQMTLSNDQIVVNIGLVDLNTLIQGTALLSDGFGGVAPLRILATPRSQPLLSTLSGAIESFTASSDLQQVFTIGPGAITSPDGTQVTYTLSIDNYPSTPTASGWCRIDAGALGLSAQVYCSSPLTRQITIHIAALEGIPHQPGRLDVDKIVEFIPAPIITIPFDFSNSKYAPAVAGLGGSVAFVLLLLIIKRNWDAQNTHSRIVNLTKVDQWRKELHHMALLLKSDASEDLFHTIQEEEGSYESDSEEEETALTFIESVTRLIQALDSFQDALSSDIEKGGRKPTEFLAQKTYHLRQSYEDILIKFQHLIDHQDDDPMSHSNYMTLLTNLEETIKAVALNIKTLLKSSKLLTSQGLLPIVSRAYIYFTRYYATLCPTKDIYTLLDLESLITDYVAVIQANVESYHENSEVDLLFEQLDALINLALLYHSATPDVMAQIVPFNRLEVFYCCAPQQIPLKTIPSSVYNSLLSALTRIKNKTETLNAHKINHVASASLNALTHLSESSKTSFFGALRNLINKDERQATTALLLSNGLMGVFLGVIRRKDGALMLLIEQLEELAYNEPGFISIAKSDTLELTEAQQQLVSLNRTFCLEAIANTPNITIRMEVFYRLSRIIQYGVSDQSRLEALRLVKQKFVSDPFYKSRWCGKDTQQIDRQIDMITMMFEAILPFCIQNTREDAGMLFFKSESYKKPTIHAAKELIRQYFYVPDHPAIRTAISDLFKRRLCNAGSYVASATNHAYTTLTAVHAILDYQRATEKENAKSTSKGPYPRKIEVLLNMLTEVIHICQINIREHILRTLIQYFNALDVPYTPIAEAVFAVLNRPQLQFSPEFKSRCAEQYIDALMSKWAKNPMPMQCLALLKRVHFPTTQARMDFIFQRVVDYFNSLTTADPALEQGIVSLLEDPECPVTPEIASRCTQHYCETLIQKWERSAQPELLKQLLILLRNSNIPAPMAIRDQLLHLVIQHFERIEKDDDGYGQAIFSILTHPELQFSAEGKEACIQRYTTRLRQSWQRSHQSEQLNQLIRLLNEPLFSVTPTHKGEILGLIIQYYKGLRADDEGLMHSIYLILINAECGIPMDLKTQCAQAYTAILIEKWKRLKQPDVLEQLLALLNNTDFPLSTEAKGHALDPLIQYFNTLQTADDALRQTILFVLNRLPSQETTALRARQYVDTLIKQYKRLPKDEQPAQRTTLLGILQDTDFPLPTEEKEAYLRGPLRFTPEQYWSQNPLWRKSKRVEDQEETKSVHCISTSPPK